MQFLRTLIWVLLAVIVAAFAFNNWVSVPVRLWGGLIADINLPLLMGLAFALGFVPLYLLHATARWRAKSRIAAHERTIAELRAATMAPPPPPIVPDVLPDPVDAPTPGPAPATASPPPPPPPGGLL
ncbi:lipopolysaccharide assembly protein LapA domain-containing protein [Sphingomonas japonica]|uniref:Integral membrane protein n=1 Tax=Sphingomonas japonica TaxID=511662 RepID=A0ABX0U4G0_9SPHN|nr:lipopolysaccharide assembly protein LapA domain-containing protein [Sphingomonas japonica]NIJ24281.1 putative integral membrane protein [Sphingomonas japonica]